MPLGFVSALSIPGGFSEQHDVTPSFPSFSSCDIFGDRSSGAAKTSFLAIEPPLENHLACNEGVFRAKFDLKTGRFAGSITQGGVLTAEMKNGEMGATMVTPLDGGQNDASDAFQGADDPEGWSDEKRQLVAGSANNAAGPLFTVGHENTGAAAVLYSISEALGLTPGALSGEAVSMAAVGADFL